MYLSRILTSEVVALVLKSADICTPVTLKMSALPSEMVVAVAVPDVVLLICWFVFSVFCDSSATDLITVATTTNVAVPLTP